MPRLVASSMLPLEADQHGLGVSRGITPVAAAKATRPEPAGKEMPMGKRVWGVAAGAEAGVRTAQAVEPEWITPSPGRRDAPPRGDERRRLHSVIAHISHFG